MKRVLVTAIGTVTASSIVKILRNTGSFFILGADINNRNEIATSRDVDEYYQFPYSTEEDYIPYAIDFCKEHQIDYYIAVIDKEVLNISKAREDFAAIGTKLCVPEYETVSKCHFKNLFGEWITIHFPEIAIRRYRSIEEAKETIFPLFVKPVEGVASTGCRKIETFSELNAYVGSNEIGKKVLLQDYIEGHNITIDCIRNRRTGQKKQIQRRELLRNSNGCGIAVEIIHDSNLTVICDAIMEALDLNGVVNMEFFDTKTGYKIIEINPRFSAGTMYTYMAGVNTVLNAIRIVDGLPCEFGDIAIGSHFAERYEVYRMD